MLQSSPFQKSNFDFSGRGHFYFNILPPKSALYVEGDLFPQPFFWLSAISLDLSFTTPWHGKLQYYNSLLLMSLCTENCYEKALRDRREAAVQFEAATARWVDTDAEWQKWKTECSKVSDELHSLKKLSPEAAPLLAGFTPFEDIPPTVAAAVPPLLVCIFSYTYEHKR